MSFVSGLFGAKNEFQPHDTGMTVQKDLVPQINNAYLGIKNQTDAQQQLQNALTAQAAGQGPNPVLAQFNQATGQNIANQAALMGSQRGASANPALLARQAAMQGANIQQSAVNQAGALQAQQQLNAQQALAGQQAQIANEFQNLYGAGQGALAAQNTAQNTASLGQQQLASGVAQQNAQTNGGLMGGILNAAGGVVSKIAGFNDGGMVNPKLSKVPPSDRMHLPEHIRGMADIYHDGHEFKGGGFVPGKAEVKGDSPKNDKVPAALSPGEIVIPRHIVQSKDAPKKAAEFVAKILEQHGGSHEDEKNEFKKALKEAIKGRKK